MMDTFYTCIIYNKYSIQRYDYSKNIYDMICARHGHTYI